MRLDEFVEPGTGYVLTIDFGGNMEGHNVGLYGSSYVNPEGQTR